MEKLFKTASFTRSTLVKIMEKRSNEELLKIPENYNNSIFWNIAHLLVTQQLICYKLSGLKIKIDESMVSKYGKGSIATEDTDVADIQYVKNHILDLSQEIEHDYDKGLFKDFNPYMTSTGIELRSIEDAISFGAFHDGIHLGVILSLMKIV
ncbi:MAG: DinB family protein [Flavobacteriales bacterium]|nr:DinB family protein [Flavobacteriales bacterium]